MGLLQVQKAWVQRAELNSADAEGGVRSSWTASIDGNVCKREEKWNLNKQAKAAVVRCRSVGWPISNMREFSLTETQRARALRVYNGCTDKLS